jgi:hypothetical protein
VVEQPFGDLPGLLEGGSAALNMYAKSHPLPKTSSSDWAFSYSAMVTAALLQHVARDAVVVGPGCAKGKLEHACGIVAFMNMHSSDSSRKGVPVGSVTVKKQVHTHFINIHEKPHTGKQYFASRAACDLYRQALSVLWKNTEKNTSSSTSSPLPGSSSLANSPPPRPRLLRIAIINRPHDDRNISNCAEVLSALKRAFPESEVTSHMREDVSFQEQLRVFGEADVVVAAHGGSLANLPAMKEGSLLIEVFSNPKHVGSALSFFLGLGSRCGVTHRVYHETFGHLHKLTVAPKGATVDDKAWPLNLGHAIDPRVIIGMVKEWLKEWLKAAPTILEDRAFDQEKLEVLRKPVHVCSGGCEGPTWWSSSSRLSNSSSASSASSSSSASSASSTVPRSHTRSDNSRLLSSVSKQVGSSSLQDIHAQRKRRDLLSTLLPSAPFAPPLSPPLSSNRAQEENNCFDSGALGAPFGGLNGSIYEREHGERLATERCKKSRTLLGDATSAEALALFRRKLLGNGGNGGDTGGEKNECSSLPPVDVAVMGGSVSCGNFITDRQDGPCPAKFKMNNKNKWAQGCKEEAFPAYLQAILRHRRFVACGGDQTNDPVLVAAARLSAEKVTVRRELTANWVCWLPC